MELFDSNWRKGSNWVLDGLPDSTDTDAGLGRVVWLDMRRRCNPKRVGNQLPVSGSL